MVESESQSHNPKKFTVSIGVASYPLHGYKDKVIIKAADVALYRSKERGRNCVTVCEIDEEVRII